MNAKSIGLEIRVARIRRGLTQAELAKKLGVSPSTICQWELGKTSPNIVLFNEIQEIMETIFLQGKKK